MKKVNQLLLLVILALLAIACANPTSSTTTNGTTVVFSSEGSSDSPLSLTLGTARAGKVKANDVSYYSFVATTSGSYAITVGSITGSTSLAYTLYSAANFTSAVDSTFASTGWSTISLTAGSTYYLKVFEFSNTNATFSMSIAAPAPSVTDGSLSTPLALTLGTQYSGKVNGAAYYKFTTTTAAKYTVTLSSISPVKVLTYSIYSASDYLFANWVSSGSTLTANTTYYLKVSEILNTDTTFTILITAPVTDGTAAAPVTLTVGTAYSGKANDVAFYKFTATTSGAYSITISQVSPTPTAALGWTIYTASNFTSNIASSTGSAANLTAGTTYYLKVYEWSYINESFQLLVSTP
ncbi:MAG: hypothetical protein WCQ50_08795 [Spirochaetota bacterium]